MIKQAAPNRFPDVFPELFELLFADGLTAEQALRILGLPPDRIKRAARSRTN